MVGERHLHPGHFDRLREEVEPRAFRGMPHEVGLREAQNLRIGLLGLLEPELERALRGDVLRNALVVKPKDHVVVDQDVGAARFMLELFDFADKPGVRPPKGGLGFNLPCNEPLADHDFARKRRIVRLEAHAPLLINREAVERTALEGDHLAAALLPVRFAPRASDEAAGRRLDPLGLDVGDASRVELRRLHDLRGEDPAARLLDAHGPGPNPELDPSGAVVGRHPPVGLNRLLADVAEKPGEERSVHLLERGGSRIQAPAEFGRHRLELALDVAPLPQAAGREEAALELGVELAVAFLLRASLFDPVPELHVAEEVRRRIRELTVRLVRRLLRFERTLARILHGQSRSNDEQFAQRPAAASFEKHAPELRIDGELRELAADGREPLGVVDGAQFVEDRVAVRNRLRGRRLHEGEFPDVAKLQSRRAQDHRGQVRAHDLGIGEGRTPGVVLLVVKTDADARRHAAAAPGALVGRSPAHGLDQELLDLRAVGVALHAREPRVDDEADAGHGEGGFRDVRREHDATRSARTEDALLIGRGEAREKRENLDGGGTRSAKLLGRLPNFPLAGKKDEDVAASGELELGHRAVDRRHHRAVVVLVGVLDRTPADFDGIRAPGNRENRRRPAVFGEMLGEALRVDRRRSDDHLEVGAPRQKPLQVPEEKVDVDRALVRFVDDDRVVGSEERIRLRFGQKNPVRHELDRSARRRMVREADLVAHDLSGLGLQLFGDALGDRTRRNAPRLRMTDAAGAAAARHEGDLRELRRLARSRFAADDDDLMRADRADDFVCALRHGESRREGKGRNRMPDLLKGTPRAPLAARFPRLRLRSRPSSVRRQG